MDYDVSTAIKKNAQDNPEINSNFLARRLGELAFYSPAKYIQDITKIYEENPNSDPSFG